MFFIVYGKKYEGRSEEVVDLKILLPSYYTKVANDITLISLQRREFICWRFLLNVAEKKTRFWSTAHRHDENTRIL